jgi:drug/metabolite transporter (DMT)-like permease
VTVTHLSPVLVTFWQSTLTAVFASHLAIDQGVFEKILTLNLVTWAGIWYAGILSSIVAFTLYNYGLHLVRPAESAILHYSAPLCAAIVAIPLLGEYPDMWFFIGAICIIGGVITAETMHRGKQKTARGPHMPHIHHYPRAS